LNIPNASRLNWNHIQDCQPEVGEKLVCLNIRSNGEYVFYITDHVQYGTWKQVKALHNELKLALPNFWWIRYKDFPWPDLASLPFDMGSPAA